MSGKRDVIFRVTSPVPDRIKTVTLTADTWKTIIDVKHPDMADLIEAVQTTAEQPNHVVESTTRPGHLLFLNEKVLSPNQGHPLTIAIKPIAGEGYVSTVHFKKRKAGERVVLSISENTDDDA